MLASASRRAVARSSRWLRPSPAFQSVPHVLGTGSFTGNVGASSTRGLFGSSNDSDDPDLYNYPKAKANTIINTCDQGRHHVVQRFGKFSHIVEGGLYFTLPIIDSIIEHDMREMTIPITPQTAVTRDNVYTKLSGVLFVQVIDAKKATYGIRRPLISIVKAAEAAMRNALGEMELDECFREKDKLNQAVMKVCVIRSIMLVALSEVPRGMDAIKLTFGSRCWCCCGTSRPRLFVKRQLHGVWRPSATRSRTSTLLQKSRRR